MQSRLREYLSGVAKKSKKELSLCFLGYGATNRAVLDAVSHGSTYNEITIRQDGALHDTPPDNARVICGPGALNDIYEDVIFASPSCRRERLCFPKDSIVTSDTEIFFTQSIDNLFLISGSDGKSTVTTLVSRLLFPTFPKLFTGGNLGTPLARAELSSDAFVVELSSFNLRYTRPHGTRALLTNVTPNHLDWHADLEEYEQCKMRLIEAANDVILPLSCPFLRRIAKARDCFAVVSDTDSDRELRRAYHTRHTVTLEGDELRLDGKPIIRAALVKRKGKHDFLNIMSAIAMCIGFTDEERIREVAQSFSGLEHRCEEFSLNSVRYVNSSIDTTPDRTRTTLTSLDLPVNIILGGRGKGLPLDRLKQPLLKYAKRISIYGDIAKDVLRWIDTDKELSLIPHTVHDTFVEALDDADDNLTGANTVLLSPAATSYGEFKDFEQRGSLFKDHLKEKHSKI